MSWGFKIQGWFINAKACLSLEYLKVRVGWAKVTPCCPSSSEDSKSNWRLLKCRFEVLFLNQNFFFRFCNVIVKKKLLCNT